MQRHTRKHTSKRRATNSKYQNTKKKKYQIRRHKITGGSFLDWFRRNPKHVTAANQPNPVTAANQPNPVTAANQPNPVTSANPPKPATSANPPKRTLSEIMAELRKPKPEKIKQRESEVANPNRFGYIGNPYSDKVLPDWYNIKLTLKPGEYVKIINKSSKKEFTYTNDKNYDIVIESLAIEGDNYNTITKLNIIDNENKSEYISMFTEDKSFPELELVTNKNNIIEKTEGNVIGYHAGSH